MRRGLGRARPPSRCDPRHRLHASAPARRAPGPDGGWNPESGERRQHRPRTDSAGSAGRGIDRRQCRRPRTSVPPCRQSREEVALRGRSRTLGGDRPDRRAALALARGADLQSTVDHAHSIVNEPSKLLIRRALAGASKAFTVSSTVNLSGTSIGAGFRALPRRLTLGDLSRCIDSRDHRRQLRRACASVEEPPQGAWHRIAQAISRLAVSPGNRPSASGRSVSARSSILGARDELDTRREDTETHQLRSRVMRARPRAAIPCEQCRPVWPKSSGRSRLAVPATTRHRPRSSAPTVRPCRQ